MGEGSVTPRGISRSLNPNGRGLEQLTFNNADDYGPEYSPGEGRITFTSDRGGAAATASTTASR